MRGVSLESRPSWKVRWGANEKDGLGMSSECDSGDRE